MMSLDATVVCQPSEPSVKLAVAPGEIDTEAGSVVMCSTCRSDSRPHD